MECSGIKEGWSWHHTECTKPPRTATLEDGEFYGTCNHNNLCIWGFSFQLPHLAGVPNLSLLSLTHRAETQTQDQTSSRLPCLAAPLQGTATPRLGADVLPNTPRPPGGPPP